MDEIAKCLQALEQLEYDVRMVYGYPAIELCSDGSGKVDFGDGWFYCDWDNLNEMLSTIQLAVEARTGKSIQS